LKRGSWLHLTNEKASAGEHKSLGGFTVVNLLVAFVHGRLQKVRVALKDDRATELYGELNEE
jgi:hypothetical protein